MGPILARISTARAWGVSGFVAEMVEHCITCYGDEGEQWDTECQRWVKLRGG
jgi:hypothetical protein